MRGVTNKMSCRILHMYMYIRSVPFTFEIKETARKDQFASPLFVTSLLKHGQAQGSDCQRHSASSWILPVVTSQLYKYNHVRVLMYFWVARSSPINFDKVSNTCCLQAMTSCYDQVQKRARPFLTVILKTLRWAMCTTKVAWFIKWGVFLLELWMYE